MRTIAEVGSKIANRCASVRGVALWAAAFAVATAMTLILPGADNGNQAASAVFAKPGKVVGCVAKGSSFRDTGPRRGRMIAVTFDGGPTREYTPRVLKTLRRYKVKATFFVRGSFSASHRKILRRIHREGHELANHSYTHPRLPSGRELKRTNRVIRRTTGFKPCLFRAPYGALSDSLIKRARNQKMLTIGWDVDSWDAYIENLDAGTIYRRVTRRSGPGSIVLMHDGIGNHKGTLRALPRILNRLKERKLKQVTVSRLLRLRQLTTSRGS